MFNFVPAISILLDELTVEDAVDELEGRHVGSTARAVHGEEAQTDAVEAIQVVEGIRQKLTSFLGGSVGRHRALDSITLR